MCTTWKELTLTERPKNAQQPVLEVVLDTLAPQLDVQFSAQIRSRLHNAVVLRNRRCLARRKQMMPMNLQRLFDVVLSALPVSLDAEMTLSPGELVVPDTQLETSEIVLLRGEHSYDGPYTQWRIDRPTMCLTVEASASFGLLLLASVLSPKPISVDLRLTHPGSDLRLIRVVSPPLCVGGLRMVPAEFLYLPTVPRRNPWGDTLTPWDYPSFCVMVDDKGAEHPETGVRDVLRGFGTVAGMSRLAQLFLDASRPTTQEREFDLECEGGFRGVSPLSAELKILLPNSEMWPSQLEIPAAT